VTGCYILRVGIFIEIRKDGPDNDLKLYIVIVLFCVMILYRFGFAE
jgi:hypothetical protein